FLEDRHRCTSTRRQWCARAVPRPARPRPRRGPSARGQRCPGRREPGAGARRQRRPGLDTDGHGTGQAQWRRTRPGGAPAGLDSGGHGVGQLRRKLAPAWARPAAAEALATDGGCSCSSSVLEEQIGT
ncbi:unnamed protein product, partial [Urochloa humidicola]